MGEHDVSLIGFHRKACGSSTCGTHNSIPCAGCGASNNAAAGLVITEQQRDPEDYSLEPLQLQITNIEEFDAVFGRLQDLLNR